MVRTDIATSPSINESSTQVVPSSAASTTGTGSTNEIGTVVLRSPNAPPVSVNSSAWSGSRGIGIPAPGPRGRQARSVTATCVTETVPSPMVTSPE